MTKDCHGPYTLLFHMIYKLDLASLHRKRNFACCKKKKHEFAMVIKSKIAVIRRTTFAMLHQLNCHAPIKLKFSIFQRKENCHDQQMRNFAMIS